MCHSVRTEVRGQVVPGRIPRALLLCTLRLPDPPRLQRILTSSPPASYRSAGVMVRDLSGTRRF